MTAHAVVVIDHSPARDRLRLMLRPGHPVTLLHLAIGLAGQEHAQIDDVGVVEVEIRHQLLDVLGLVDARGLELVERPVIQVSGMLVWLPKNNSSRCLEPKVVSSTPMRASLSIPSISWHPKHPYLRTSAWPFLIFSGSLSAVSTPASSFFSPCVIRNAVNASAS